MPRMRRAPTWARVAVPLLVVLVAAAVRLTSLASPQELIWDEHYYVFDAEVYLGGGIGQPVGTPPAVKIADEGTWVHPPMGKWMIALLGVGPLGMRSFGWRLPSALFGIAGVLLLYLLALQLWGSVWWAALAALMLALDGLHIVQSRVATLDIFLTTFITAGMLLLVLDRRRMDDGRDRPPHPRWERVFGSRYRLGAGAAFGAAAATKWSGMFALGFAIVLTTVWAFQRGRRTPGSGFATLGSILAALVAVPLAVYLISYGAFFYQHGFAIRDFLTLQLRMLQYQAHHTRIQPENSSPWTWPLLLHPIRYYGVSTRDTATRIVALGNPAVWWAFLLLLPVAFVTVIRAPRWQDAVVFGGYAAMFAPWLFVGRSQFIYYMLPAVPFMCLAIPSTLRRLPHRLARALGVAMATVTVAVASAFLPVWIGWSVPLGYLDHLRWLRSWPM